MKTHIVYVPGLGDGYDWFRSAALKTWPLYGVSTTYVPISWFDGGSMSSKLKRVEVALQRIPSGRHIVLIGESAGAALALNGARKFARIDQVITICGVASRQAPISRRLRTRAPALDEAVRTLPVHVQLPVHSIRARYDPVVDKKYSTAPGATPHVIWSLGHSTTIALCLTLLAPFVTAIAKQSKR